MKELKVDHSIKNLEKSSNSCIFWEFWVLNGLPPPLSCHLLNLVREVLEESEKKEVKFKDFYRNSDCIHSQFWCQESDTCQNLCIYVSSLADVWANDCLLSPRLRLKDAILVGAHPVISQLHSMEATIPNISISFLDALHLKPPNLAEHRFQSMLSII